MDRRAFLGTLGLLAAPLVGEAQQARPASVGYLGNTPLSALSDHHP
jgi:hypothetical protein